MCTVMDILTISSMPPIFVTDFLSEQQFKKRKLKSFTYPFKEWEIDIHNIYMEARKETEKEG